VKTWIELCCKHTACTLIFVLLPALAQAGKPLVEINIERHLFVPSEITIPANTKVKLRVHNRDATPEEFESWELNREKVIMGNSTATIFIGPLPPGVYPFFGEFNPKTAQGKVIVE
jgi:plastocyanin